MPLDAGGDGCPTREGGSGQGTQESFYSTLLLVPKNEGSDETSDQPTIAWNPNTSRWRNWGPSKNY